MTKLLKLLAMTLLLIKSTVLSGQWMQVLPNGDTALCFSGQSLDMLDAKLVRFDSILADSRYKDTLIVNLEYRAINNDNLIIKQDKKIKRLERIKTVLFTTNGILFIFVVILMI